MLTFDCQSISFVLEMKSFLVQKKNNFEDARKQIVWYDLSNINISDTEEKPNVEVPRESLELKIVNARKVFVETVRKVVILLKFIESAQQRKRNKEMEKCDMYLKMKECQEVITRKKDSTKDKEEWDDKDIMSINYIYSALSNKQMEYVKKFDTAFER